MSSSTDTIIDRGTAVTHFAAETHLPSLPELEKEEEERETGSIDRQLLLNSWPHRAGHVIEELLHTEKTYLESLQDIINGYLKPLYEFLLQESQGPQFIEIVFCNIRKLYNIHLQLYSDFMSVFNKPQEFANVFNKHAENFKEYTHYCTNFPLCERTLQTTLQSNPNTQQFITQCQVRLGHPLPLITYLHKPVQRILKYRLLLEQVVKRFQENSSEQKELKKALETMSRIANEINEVKKKQENLTRVKSIEKQLKGLKGSELSGSSLMAHGHLLHEETCKVLGRGGGERNLLLFEKMLLFLKKKGEKSYVYKGHIKVSELDLSGKLRKETLLKLFSIHTPTRPIIIEVRSKRVKEELISVIQSLLVSQMKKEKTITREEREESNKEFELERSNARNPSNTRLTNVARQRSLVSSDLQTRRRTRQMSTRKFSVDDRTIQPQHNRKDTYVKDEESKSNISGDSGISTTTITSTEEDESPRLRRKTAFRRRKMHTISGSEREEFSSPLASSGSDLSGSWEEREGKVSKNEMESVGNNEINEEPFESSLDIKPRSFTYSHNELLKSTENFIYPESYYRPLGEGLSSLEGGEERLRRRSDTCSMPPDPFQVLGHNRMYSSGLEERMEGLKEEEEEESREEEVNEIQLRLGAAERRSIYSRHFDDSGDSLGSNASSLCLEDHYFLSQTSKSAIIAGKDGENIVIYDEDSDDSDYEDEDEEEEEEERERGSEEGEDDTRVRGSDVAVESSLRSYLSMTNLFPSDELYNSSVTSPLATLPRNTTRQSSTGTTGISSPLLYTHKKNLLQRCNTDVLLSLPLQSTSQDSQWYNSPETPLIEQSFIPTTDTPYNQDTNQEKMWPLYDNNDKSVLEESCSSMDQQPLTLSSAIQQTTPTHIPTNFTNNNTIVDVGTQPANHCHSPIPRDEDDTEISNLLLKNNIERSSPGYHSPSSIEEDIHHSRPLSREEERFIPDNYHLIPPNRIHYRSSSVPPRESPYTRPVYHHWTPSPPPVSIEETHTAIDMSVLLEQDNSSMNSWYNRQSPVSMSSNEISNEIPSGSESPNEIHINYESNFNEIPNGSKSRNETSISSNEIKNPIEIFQESQLRSRLLQGTYKGDILPTHHTLSDTKSTIQQTDVKVTATLTRIIAAGSILTSCFPSYSFSIVLICILILVGLVLFLIVLYPGYFYGNTTA